MKKLSIRIPSRSGFDEYTRYEGVEMLLFEWKPWRIHIFKQPLLILVPHSKKSQLNCEETVWLTDWVMSYTRIFSNLFAARREGWRWMSVRKKGEKYNFQKNPLNDEKVKSLKLELFLI